MEIRFGEKAKTIVPDLFDSDHHYYHKVINAQINSLIVYFMNMSRQRIV